MFTLCMLELTDVRKYVCWNIYSVTRRYQRQSFDKYQIFRSHLKSKFTKVTEIKKTKLFHLTAANAGWIWGEPPSKISENILKINMFTINQVNAHLTFFKNPPRHFSCVRAPCADIPIYIYIRIYHRRHRFDLREW